MRDKKPGEYTTQMRTGERASNTRGAAGVSDQAGEDSELGVGRAAAGEVRGGGGERRARGDRVIDGSLLGEEVYFRRVKQTSNSAKMDLKSHR